MQPHPSAQEYLYLVRDFHLDSTVRDELVVFGPLHHYDPKASRTRQALCCALCGGLMLDLQAVPSLSRMMSLLLLLLEDSVEQSYALTMDRLSGKDAEAARQVFKVPACPPFASHSQQVSSVLTTPVTGAG